MIPLIIRTLNESSLNITWGPKEHCHRGSIRLHLSPHFQQQIVIVHQLQMLQVAQEVQCIMGVARQSLCRISTILLVQINNLIHNPEQEELLICMRAIKAPREDRHWQGTD
jgi:hypothetical protein